MNGDGKGVTQNSIAMLQTKEMLTRKSIFRSFTKIAKALPKSIKRQYSGTRKQLTQGMLALKNPLNAKAGLKNRIRFARSVPIAALTRATSMPAVAVKCPLLQQEVPSYEL
jgi:hypothetical protein